MNFYFSEQIRRIERNAMALGMNALRMMENAGAAAARVIRERYPLEGVQAVVLCGQGNNGGDGYVVARKLRESGAAVLVVQALGAPLTAEAQEMMNRADAQGVAVLDFSTMPERALMAVEQASLIVDAIFGLGFRGQPEEPLCRLIDCADRMNAAKIALDMPSGAMPDTGEVVGSCMHCDITVGFIGFKVGYALLPAAEYCGQPICVAIGLPDSAMEGVESALNSIDEDLVRTVIRPRPRHCHKGDFGQAAILAGSYGMSGASLLAARAAVYTGAGLVRLLLPECNYSIVAPALPETVYSPLGQNEQGGVSRGELIRVLADTEEATAFLAGCGMGDTFDTAALIEGLLANVKCPLVIDADGLNGLSGRIDLIKASGAEVILTPHPGEMARLCGLTVAEIENDRPGFAGWLAKQQGCIVVLKGSHTVVALPDGHRFINLTGNGGMATAGSGDVLAGMLVSLIAQGINPADAAICAVWLHARAGDRAAAIVGQRSLTPSMMLEQLPLIFREFEAVR